MRAWNRLVRSFAFQWCTAREQPRRRAHREIRHWYGCTGLESRELLAAQLGAVTVGPQVGGLTYGTGGSATYLVTVDRGTDPGAFDASLTVSTPLPSGVSFGFDVGTLSFGDTDNSRSALLTVTSSSTSPATALPFAFTVRSEIANSGEVALSDGVLTIARKVLTGSITAANKVFDGDDSAEITDRTLVGVVSGDDVTLVGGTATFDDEQIGVGKTVTATGLTLAGAAAANYTVNDTATTTASILSGLELGPLIVNDMPTTKDELVALPVSLAGSGAVSFTVESTNPNVTATLLTGGRSLRLNVTGAGFGGDLVFRLFEAEDPVTTARIIALAESGFYDGLTFHRVIDGFVAQGGDPDGDGSGGSGTTFDDTFRADLTFTGNGLLAMANSGDDTNDSQFFVTDVDLPLASLPQHLNFQHSVFGILTGGFDTFRALIGTPTDEDGIPMTDDDDRPTTEVVIHSATVFTDTQNGVVRLHAAPGITGATTLKVTANDGQGSVDEIQTTVNVVADTINDRAFLGPVSDQTATQGLPVTFQVSGIDLENDALTFFVKDPDSFPNSGSIGSAPANVAVSIQVTPAAGLTPASAAITLTPSVTFSGTIDLLVGVSDLRPRPSVITNSLGNFDTQRITLTVNPANHAPTTAGGSTTTLANQEVAIQLSGDDGDPDKTQTLTFEIVTPPQHGTVSGFSAAAGSLKYTPAAGFAGSDSFTYRVRDNGGTANGGQDASAVSTFTIHVGAPVPTGLALAASSDDGVFNDDRVFSNSNPTFTVDARAGAAVVFLVNGASSIAAVETAPGRFSAALPRSLLRVGGNTISATANVGGVASAASPALAFTYAPNYDHVYTVPGDFGSQQRLTFRWTARAAAFNNEIGVFQVDDPSGRIAGRSPGDAGYAAAALNGGGRRVIFGSGAGAGATTTIDVRGGDLLVFYLVANDTTARFLARNPGNQPNGLNAYFSVDSANPGGVDHVMTIADPQTGRLLLQWEDLLFGGDRDYNDVVIAVTPAATHSATIGGTLRVPGGAGHDVATTFTLGPARRPAGSMFVAPTGAALGEIGVYVVTDEFGTVSGVEPGSLLYLQTVFGNSSRQTLFHAGDPAGTQATAQLPGGALVAWYYVSGSTAEDVLADNPGNLAAGGPVAVFSFANANPDGAEHFRWHGPERNGAPVTEAEAELGLRLHLLDELFGSPSKFDDMLVTIQFAE